MGSLIEINDTLQLTKEQGFPEALDLNNHLKNPLRAEQFSDTIFEFHSKAKIRFYQVPPVRNFLVENRDGRWIYWGLVHMFEIRHDYQNHTTSGRFKIIYIYPPEEMKQAHDLIDRNADTNYFS